MPFLGSVQAAWPAPHKHTRCDAQPQRRYSSKSKCNGVTIEDWLKNAAPESHSLFMFQNPKRAKKLYKEIVPKAVDEYLDCIEKSKNQSNKEILLNPVWHVHNLSLIHI